MEDGTIPEITRLYDELGGIASGPVLPIEIMTRWSVM